MAIIDFFDGIQLYQVMILVAGLIFLIIEMFSPGFGVSGSIGLVLLVVGILITASTALEALVMFIILVIIVALALMVILRSAKKGRLSKALILNDELNKESGFTSTVELGHYIDKEGIALSTLRPAGIAEFDGVKLDVVTDGEYVQIGTRVKIIKVEGRRVVVRSMA